MTDINELRRLAQAATPGPWMLRTAPTSAGLCHIISAADWRGAFIYGDGLRIGVDDSLPKAQELAANAHLIAAANPAAINELLDRLEAAEKERDNVTQQLVQSEIGKREISEAHNAVTRRLSVLADENTALRAKVAEMEKQEPVMWANSSNINSSRINKERGGCGDQHTCSETQTTYHDAPLYALPGAQGEEK